ncbi:hypothetical protein BE17_41230 [Sorangium cellulosum]|uniref:Uncharacterized protein n=1 Tax=Sorangium cellulosum TaxID=56 RepID=A0A150SK62_SORCE|nr:hypothetical protein BE17_41230 [Sorangium cellulosum]
MAVSRLKRLGAALIEAQTARRLSPEASLTQLVLGRVLLAHRKPSEAREHVASTPWPRSLGPCAPPRPRRRRAVP